MTAGLPSHDTTTGRPATPASPDAPTSYVTGIADGNLATPVRLLDYLTAVGVVFRLPRRDRKKEAKEAAAEEKARRQINIPVRKILYLVTPIVLGWVGYQAYDRFLATVPLPPEVVGTWSTNDGRYKGRNFWINQKSVAFQNGKTADQFAVYEITRIRTRQAADTLFVTVEYDQEGETATLSIGHQERAVPEVWLVNQPKVRWRRTSERATTFQ